MFHALQEQNKALRLKDDIFTSIEEDKASESVIDNEINDDDERSNQSKQVLNNIHYIEYCFRDSLKTRGGNIRWQYFSETAYIAGDRLRSGEDKYSRNKFNQVSSKSIVIIRELK